MVIGGGSQRLQIANALNAYLMYRISLEAPDLSPLPSLDTHKGPTSIRTDSIHCAQAMRIVRPPLLFRENLYYVCLRKFDYVEEL